MGASGRTRMGPTSPLPFRRTLSVFRVPLSSPYFLVRDTGLRCGDLFRYADLQGGIQVRTAHSLIALHLHVHLTRLAGGYL